jgi:hypothetical protein
MVEGHVCVYEVFILGVVIPFEVGLGSAGLYLTMGLGSRCGSAERCCQRERSAGCAVLLGSYCKSWSYGRELRLCDDKSCPKTHHPGLC